MFVTISAVNIYVVKVDILDVKFKQRFTFDRCLRGYETGR